MSICAMRRGHTLFHVGLPKHLVLALTCFVLGLTQLALEAAAQQQLEGQVLGARAPIAHATVALWAASADAPAKLSETQSDANGHFALPFAGAPTGASSLYLLATGGVPAASPAGGNNPAIALLTVLGTTPPANVVVNEFTTVASIWTGNQFIDGSVVRGHALGLRIAAGNVPNFVDLQSGGWGSAIQDPSTAAKRRPWPISQPWPTCFLAASPG